MAVKVEALREQYEARISKAAFVELLLFRGIGVTKAINGQSDTQPDSTFKK